MLNTCHEVYRLFIKIFTDSSVSQYLCERACTSHRQKKPPKCELATQDSVPKTKTKRFLHGSPVPLIFNLIFMMCYLKKLSTYKGS